MTTHLTYDAVIANDKPTRPPRSAVPPLDLAALEARAARVFTPRSPTASARSDAALAAVLGPDSLLAAVGSDLATYIKDVTADRATPVTRGESPAALAAAFAAAGTPLPLSADDPPLDAPAVRSLISTVLSHAVRTGAPRFFGQLYARADAAAIAADWAVSAAPAAVHTWDAAPVACAAEAAVIARLGDLAGGDYANGGADGLALPGGSAANAAALTAARHVADPGARTRGAVGGPRLVAFVSEAAHFSFDKAAVAMGLGTDNLVKIETRADGAMDPTALASALAAAVADGRSPFFVAATAGTTVLGAFDPIDPIAEIAEAYGCWLHVDAAWGGACLLSADHAYRLAGLARADSFAVSPHKMLGVPLQASLLVTRRGGALTAANAVGDAGAGYLYRPDAAHSAADRGDAYCGCGRRADALKVWIAWKAAGEAGLGAKVDAAVGLAAYAAAAIRLRGGGGGEEEGEDGGALASSSSALVLAADPTYANVCFYYVPPSLRPYDPAAPADDPAHSAMAGVAPRVRARVLAAGGPVVSLAPIPGKPHAPPAFRLVLANPATVKTADVDALLDAVAAAGDAEYA